MRIVHVKLQTRNPDTLKPFYTERLGLPLIAGNEHSFTVRAGRSTLTFVGSINESPYYHFAFAVPSDRIGEAPALLASLGVEPYRFGGGHHLVYSKTWHASSVYFRDSAGNILELIAHHDRPRAEEEDGPAAVSSIAELGLPVEDVRGTADLLRRRYGLALFRDDGDERFAAAGDAEGLFILSRVGRIWAGSDMEARVFPAEIRVEGLPAGEHPAFDGYPYTIHPQQPK